MYVCMYVCMYVYIYIYISQPSNVKITTLNVTPLASYVELTHFLFCGDYSW